MHGQNDGAGRPRRRRTLIGAVLAAAAGLTCSTPPEPGLAYRQEAESSLAEGAPRAAVDAYLHALAVNPDDLEARRGLLRARVAAGDGEAALMTLQELVRLDAEPVDPCPALALVTEERLEGGLDARDAASRAVDAGCSGSKRRLARVLAEESRAMAVDGDREAAIERLRAAIALDPELARYYLDAAELLIEAGRERDAIALLASGLERHPEDRPLRDLMVRALSIR